jgi:hypothetical protein
MLLKLSRDLQNFQREFFAQLPVRPAFLKDLPAPDVEVQPTTYRQLALWATVIDQKLRMIEPVLHMSCVVVEILADGNIDSFHARERDIRITVGASHTFHLSTTMVQLPLDYLGHNNRSSFLGFGKMTVLFH